jgi:hypothetical protein
VARVARPLAVTSTCLDKPGSVASFTRHPQASAAWVEIPCLAVAALAVVPTLSAPAVEFTVAVAVAVLVLKEPTAQAERVRMESLTLSNF